jgi:hypothetical protein
MRAITEFAGQCGKAFSTGAVKDHRCAGGMKGAGNRRPDPTTCASNQRVIA